MNIKNTSFFSPLIILFSLVLFRIIPHPPNFTPIIAFAVISAYFFNNRVLAFFILALSLAIPLKENVKVTSTAMNNTI